MVKKFQSVKKKSFLFFRHVLTPITFLYLGVRSCVGAHFLRDDLTFLLIPFWGADDFLIAYYYIFSKKKSDQKWRIRHLDAFFRFAVYRMEFFFLYFDTMGDFATCDTQDVFFIYFFIYFIYVLGKRG